MFSLLKLVWFKTEKKKCSCICSFAVPMENIVIFTLSSYFSNHFFIVFSVLTCPLSNCCGRPATSQLPPRNCLPLSPSRSRCNSTRQPQAHSNAMNRTKKVNRQGQKIRVLTKHPTRTLSLLQVCVNVFDNLIPFKIEFFFNDYASRRCYVHAADEI